jgi:hypothetical protein
MNALKFKLALMLLAVVGLVAFSPFYYIMLGPKPKAEGIFQALYTLETIVYPFLTLACGVGALSFAFRILDGKKPEDKKPSGLSTFIHYLLHGDDDGKHKEGEKQNG